MNFFLTISFFWYNEYNLYNVNDNEYIYVYISIYNLRMNYRNVEEKCLICFSLKCYIFNFIFKEENKVYLKFLIFSLLETFNVIFIYFTNLKFFPL